MFLINMESYICFAVLSVFAYAFCAFFALRSEYFYRLRQTYIFNGIITCLQASFVDVTLASLIQLKNFTFGFTGVYTLCCFAACFAVLVELAYLSLSFLLLLRSPADVLLSPSLKDRYSALYNELRPNKRSLITTTVHNLRVFLLIVILVAAADYAMVQSLVYVTSSILGIVWDIWSNPYEGRMQTVQMLFMSAAKLAMGAGFVVLTVPGVGQDVADTASLAVVIMFLASIGGGLAMAVAQQLIGGYYLAKEACPDKTVKGKICVTAEFTSAVDVSASQGSSQITSMANHTQN